MNALRPRPRSPARRLRVLLQRERRRGRRYQPRFRLSQIVVTSLGALSAVALMGQQLRCLHPPAGGMAFLAAWLGVSWMFLVFPVLCGSLLLVALARVFSRWVPGAMPYPLHWL